MAIGIYQNCCKKCGSILLHTEVKGNNTGLYCDDCGAWIKWLGKDELRAFEHSENKQEKKFNCSECKDNTKCEYFMTDYVGSSIAGQGKRYCEGNKKSVEYRLQEFVNFLDAQIDKQLTREPLSVEDNISKCSYAHAYEKNKNALLNIIAGRDWNDNGE